MNRSGGQCLPACMLQIDKLSASKLTQRTASSLGASGREAHGRRKGVRRNDRCDVDDEQVATRLYGTKRRSPRDVGGAGGRRGQGWGGAGALPALSVPVVPLLRSPCVKYIGKRP